MAGVKWFDLDDSSSDGWVGEPTLIYLYVRRLDVNRWQFVINLSTLFIDNRVRETRELAKLAAESYVRSWVSAVAKEVLT